VIGDQVEQQIVVNRWIGTELGRLMMVMHRGSRAPIRTMHGGGALRPIHFSFNAKQTTRPSV
jgi:hypothetical protein